MALEIDSLSLLLLYTIMNNFNDDDEGGGVSGALEVLTGCAFNEEISKLALSRSSSSVLVASTWSGDLNVFSILAGQESKKYVGRFTSSSSDSGEIKSPILDCAFSPSNGNNVCVCFGTLAGELLCGESVTRVLKREGGDPLEKDVLMNESVKVVGTHKDAIKNVFFLEDKPDVVFSAGWDLYLNAWDLRMPSRSRKILSNALPFKPHLADAKNNRVLFVSAEGKKRRYDSSVILLTNAPSFERTTSRSFLNKKDFGEGQQQQQLGQYQHVRSCALSFNPKHSYGAQREEEDERRDSRKQQQQQQPSCDFVLGLSNSKCSVEFFREELDEKYAYNFLCHRETVRADDAPKFAFQRQQQKKKNQQRKVLLHPINGCTFIQQSTNLLVTGGGDGKVELWSTKTREHLETVCDFKKGSSISQLAVNEPGDLIAVAVTKNNSSSRNTTHKTTKSRIVYVKHFRPDETEETATRGAEK